MPIEEPDGYFNFFPTSCNMADNTRIFWNIFQKYCASASSISTTQVVKCDLSE